MSHFLRAGAVAALPRGMGVATAQTMLVTRGSLALGALAGRLCGNGPVSTVWH